MEMSTNNHHNPLVNILLMITSAIFYVASINSESFRAWTWWTLGITVFIFAIIRDFPKVKEVIKKYFDDKKSTNG